MEAPTEHFEHAEHAEHAAHENNPFLTTVSVTIAILAVAAAAVGSLESIETNGTIGAKNTAVLMQSKASDQWAFYQAKGVKKNIYDVAVAGGHPKAADYARDSARYATEQEDIKKEAEALEKKSEAALAESEKHEGRHHTLTMAVTLLHVSIAIATISIITRGQRWPWYGALSLGAAGALVAASAYVLGGGAH